MESRKAAEKHLRLALQDIGEIKPWYDRWVKEWVFKHPLYPVECGGKTKKDVVKDYPLYLREFIAERLANNLNPRIEKQTKGRDGKRPGAGRPKGTKKETKTRIYLSEELAFWLKDPENLAKVKRLMSRNHQ